jgi:Family of unknown function (DUF6130)
VLAHAGGAPEFAATGLVGLGFVTGWIGLSRIRGRGFGSLPRWCAFGLIAATPVILAASIVVPSRLWPSPVAVRPTSTATIAFAEPTAGATETGSTMEVLLDLEGGRVVQGSTTDLTPNTGHIHVFVDGAIVSMTYGEEQEILIGDLAPGPHRLRAEFVAADHAPFAPRVTTSVTFVKEEA